MCRGRDGDGFPHTLIERQPAHFVCFDRTWLSVLIIQNEPVVFQTVHFGKSSPSRPLYNRYPHGGVL